MWRSCVCKQVPALYYYNNIVKSRPECHQISRKPISVTMKRQSRGPQQRWRLLLLMMQAAIIVAIIIIIIIILVMCSSTIIFLSFIFYIVVILFIIIAPYVYIILCLVNTQRISHKILSCIYITHTHTRRIFFIRCTKIQVPEIIQLHEEGGVF